MNWQEIIVYLIVGSATVYLSMPSIRHHLFPIFAQYALKKGKVKWAMKLRALSIRRASHQTEF